LVPLQVGQCSPLIVVELALAEIAKVLSLLIAGSSKKQSNVRAIQRQRGPGGDTSSGFLLFAEAISG
jgi:hypothetical protein